MILFTRRHFFSLLMLVLLVGCRSEQVVFQLTTPKTPTVVPKSRSEVLAATINTDDQEVAQAPGTSRAMPRRSTRRVRLGAASHALTQSVAAAKRLVRPQLRSHVNTTAVRGVREEGEGKTWVLVLGIALVVAGVVSGILIGGGVGFFIGLPIGLLGYYFFMKGLLGPNAWLEVANELFQL